ncbi:unnamed protein product, partial [Prorocentrum cordatum]
MARTAPSTSSSRSIRRGFAGAALSITRMALSRSCEHEAEQAKMACAGEILTIASFAFTSSYAASAVSDCGNSLNMKAQCAR